jgi:hypothetical protein
MTSHTSTADNMEAPLPSPLFGRRIQIAGSASGKTDPDLISYGHRIVSALVDKVISAGGGIVVGAGKEPFANGSSHTAPSLVFDWTALEKVAEHLRRDRVRWPQQLGQPFIIVTSEKAESEIPANRRPLYDELLKSGQVQLEFIMPGSRAAVFLRQRQSAFGDALVILGGGTGVEHSVDLYMARRKPVVPLDLPIGASREDGIGGAMRLSKDARAEPNRFFRFDAAFATLEGVALADIATQNGTSLSDTVADGISSLLAKVARPHAFYVRLVNPTHSKFKTVESFFRSVVDPVVYGAGMSRIEIGTDRSDYAFMNVAIFQSLHFSSLAIVDITGERPNCFIELGYALGNATRVLVTAEEGTPLPFDQQAIPCHFWKAGSPDADRKTALMEFWDKNINRPPIVKLP